MKSRSWLSTAALSVLALCVAPAARATVAERVVAVVGEHAILLSDMRMRARPYLVQIRQRLPPGAQQAAAESDLMKQLLQKMVDERVEQQAAEKAHVSVTSDEIDNGLKNVANQQGITVERLVEEAQKTGLTAQEYRDEVRRQILEGKLLQLRVRGRVRVTEDDIKATYLRLQREERSRLGYRLAWVVLRIPPDSSAASRADRDLLAQRIVATARAGVDNRGNRVEFESLAKAFSDDAPTRLAGGDLGHHKPGDLAQAIEDEAMKLEVGGVSSPFRFKNDLVVLKVVSRDTSQLPTLDDVRDELLQRTYAEQMDKARKQWIEEMRHGTYVDVRL